MASMSTPKLALPPNLSARLAWQTRRALRRTGLPAIAGAASLSLAALAYWHGAQLEQRQATLSRQLAVAARAAATPAVPVATEADGVAAFYAYLPAHDTIPDQLSALAKVAQDSGVTLAKAEYKAEQDSQASFLRYQIMLPVRADYASVQNFIVGALQAVPALTLDSVAFKREQIESGEVEARIQFVLLVRLRGAHR